jgi:hypothetical protein
MPEPVAAIKRALTDAEEIRPAAPGSDRVTYVGPPFGAGFFRDDCFHVVVEPEPNEKGWVVTIVRHRSQQFC